MKRFFSTLAVIILAAASVIGQNNQTGFLVKGILDPDIKTDSIFIYIGFEDLVAKAPVINGGFELRGRVTEPQNAMFAVKIDGQRRRSGNLILENSNYIYSRKGYHIKIKGGDLHDQVLGFESSDIYHKAVDDYEKTVSAIYNGKEDGYEPTADEERTIRDKMRKAISIESEALASIIEGSNSTILAKVFALGRTQDWANYPSEKRVEMFDLYEEQLGHASLELTNQRNSFMAAIEREKVSQTVSTGSTFKDIQGIDMDDNNIKLSEVISKNKFTVLEFWASWCGPCRAEIPNLKKAYEKYRAQGLEIYSISIDKETEKWLKALQEENTKWIQVLDSEDASKQYGVSGVPASFLIDQNGKIIATSQELRGADLDKTLSKYIIGSSVN